MSQKFLCPDGLEYFANWVLNQIATGTQISIITAITETSTNQQIPGAKAVYDLMVEAIGKISKLSKKVVDVLPATGEAETIYLVKTAPNSTVFKQHIWIDDAWHDLGTTECDLSQYWKKDELTAMSNTDVQDIIDDVMGA